MREPTRREVKKLIGFVDYGPKCHVKILFLGYEEHASKEDKERDKNLRVRMKFKRIMDLKEAHAKLGEAGCTNPFEDEGNPVRVWNCAARFALKFEGHCQWKESKILSAYWRNHLGRKQGNTFLMESNPIPKSKHDEQTLEMIWEERKKVLAKHLRVLKPQFVIAYGKGTRKTVEELFHVQESEWKRKRCVSFASTGGTHIAHVGFFGRGFTSKKDIPFVVEELMKRDR